MNTNNTWTPDLAISRHCKTSLASVKNNFWRIFGTQRNLKASCSESIYKENISNIRYIGKQLCWGTIRTTKKFLTRTRAVKLLTMFCHIKVRHSFLVNRNRFRTSVQVGNGRLTVVFLQIFLSFCCGGVFFKLDPAVRRIIEFSLNTTL